MLFILDFVRQRKIQVILFGLDAASSNVIQAWVEEGQLPTFARMLREGSHGILKSTLPPVTVPAWAAMLTGKNPGRLGYCDFSERKDGSYHFGAVNLPIFAQSTFG